MAGDSRPPLSQNNGLRPTLSTRIRRSFEGKRRENNFLPETSDPDALRNAVEQAIGSPAFQNALAANIANILKPSITVALDTIQPVVEAVYAHDVLLRKTSEGVEDMLERMETGPEDGGAMSPFEGKGYYDMEFKALLEKSHKRTVMTLAELSNTIKVNNGKVDGLEAAVGRSEQQVGQFQSYFQQEVEHLRSQVERMSQVLDAQTKAQDETRSMLSENADKVHNLPSDNITAKEFEVLSEKLDTVSGELNTLRASFDAGLGTTSGGFSEIALKVDLLATAFQSHEDILEDLRDADASKHILTALQDSNDSHQSHATILADLKERSLLPQSTSNGVDNGVQDLLHEIRQNIGQLAENSDQAGASHREHITKLEARLDHLRASVENQHSSSSNADILEALQRSNDSHDSHTRMLGDLNVRSLAPTQSEHSSSSAVVDEIRTSLSELQTHITQFHLADQERSQVISDKVDGLLPILQSQMTSNSTSEILAALDKSNQSHASHASTLDSLKSFIVVPTPSSNSGKLDLVETQLSNIMTSLDTQAALLENISSTAADQSSTSTNDVLPALSALTTTLLTHTTLLTEIKDDIGAEILSNLHELSQTQTSHTSMLADLREADVSDEILTALHTSIEAHSGHQADLQTVHASLRGIDERIGGHESHFTELKSRGVEPVSTAAAAGGNGVELLQKRMEDLGQQLSDQRLILDAVQKDVTLATESHSAHTLAFGELRSRSHDPNMDATSSKILEDLTSKIDTLTSILEDQKAALLHIKTSTDSSLASHDAHTSSLRDLNERGLNDSTPPSDNAQLSTIADHTTSILDLLKDLDVALKTLTKTSSAANDSHSTTLDILKHTTAEQKDFHDTHATSLAEIKDLSEKTRELQIAHTATLADLLIITGEGKESHADHAKALIELKGVPQPLPSDLNELKTVLQTLESHTKYLDNILESVSRKGADEEVLAKLKEVQDVVKNTKDAIETQSRSIEDLAGQTKESKSALNTAIAGLTLGGATGAGVGYLASRDHVGNDTGSHAHINNLPHVNVREVDEESVKEDDKALEHISESLWKEESADVQPSAEFRPIASDSRADLPTNEIAAAHKSVDVGALKDAEHLVPYSSRSIDIPEDASPEGSSWPDNETHYDPHHESTKSSTTDGHAIDTPIDPADDGAKKEISCEKTDLSPSLPISEQKLAPINLDDATLDSDDDMVVEFSGKDEENDNASETQSFFTADPGQSRDVGSFAERQILPEDDRAISLETGGDTVSNVTSITPVPSNKKESDDGEDVEPTSSAPVFKATAIEITESTKTDDYTNNDLPASEINESHPVGRSPSSEDSKDTPPSEDKSTISLVASSLAEKVGSVLGLGTKNDEKSPEFSIQASVEHEETGNKAKVGAEQKEEGKYTPPSLWATDAEFVQAFTQPSEPAQNSVEESAVEHVGNTKGEVVDVTESEQKGDKDTSQTLPLTSAPESEIDDKYNIQVETATNEEASAIARNDENGVDSTHDISILSIPGHSDEPTKEEEEFTEAASNDIVAPDPVSEPNEKAIGQEEEQDYFTSSTKRSKKKQKSPKSPKFSLPEATDDEGTTETTGLEEPTTKEVKVTEQEVEDEWALPAKGKKGKKGKGKKAGDMSEPVTPGTPGFAFGDSEGNDLKSPGLENDVQTPGFQDNASADFKASEQEPEDEWALPVKGKKAKKGKGKKNGDVSEPVTPGTPGFELGDGEGDDGQDLKSPGFDDEVQTPGGSKKGKKAKKGKKGKVAFEMEGDDADA